MASNTGYVSYIPVMIITGPASARLRIALPDPVGDHPLRIHSYGVREWMPPGVLDRPHGQEFALLMVFNHAVEIGVEDRTIAVAPGSFIAWQPWAPHRYGHAHAIWNHSWINLEGPALAGFLAGSGIPLDTPLSGVPPRLLERCILAVHEELSHGTATDHSIVRNHLHTLLRQVARSVQGAAAGRVAPQLLAVRSHLETRYAEPITLRGLARLAGWSVAHLSERFRHAFGAAPIDYLIRIRLAQAHLLLRDRGLSVAATAAAVGYAEYHHFTKLFRKRYGYPPSAVRPGAVLAAERGRPREPQGGSKDHVNARGRARVR